MSASPFALAADALQRDPATREHRIRRLRAALDAIAAGEDATGWLPAPSTAPLTPADRATLGRLMAACEAMAAEDAELMLNVVAAGLNTRIAGPVTEPKPDLADAIWALLDDRDGDAG
jgi:hypothetical protein